MTETQKEAWKQPLGFSEMIEATLGQTPQNTFQLGRMTTLKGTSFTKGGALWAGEGGSIDVMLIWDTAVHWLTCHLFVPFALCTCHCDTWSHLRSIERYNEGQKAGSCIWGCVLLRRWQVRVLSRNKETYSKCLTWTLFNNSTTVWIRYFNPHLMMQKWKPRHIIWAATG